VGFVLEMVCDGLYIAPKACTRISLPCLHCEFLTWSMFCFVFLFLQQSGPSDLRHFDPEFTEEPVPNSIGRSPDSLLLTASVKEAAEAFLGFSYAPPMDSFL